MEDYRPIADEESGERQKCGNCVCFLESEKDPAVGACRFLPPRVVSETAALSPELRNDSWCQQWKPRQGVITETDPEWGEL